MCDGCFGGVARSDAALSGVRVSNVWVSASEWVCDRAAVYGKFVAGTSFD